MNSLELIPIVVKPIPGYGGRYTINVRGEVYSIPRPGTKGGVMKTLPSAQGYLRLTLTDANGRPKTEYIHKLVLRTFVGLKPEGMQCCHNDGNKDNNHLENLRYDTPSNNNLDKREHGTSGGEKNGRARLTSWQVEEIKLRYSTEDTSYSALARDYGVDKSTIGRVVCGTSWKTKGRGK